MRVNQDLIVPGAGGVEFTPEFTAGVFNQVGFYVHVDILFIRVQRKIAALKIRLCGSEPLQNLAEVRIGDNPLPGEHNRVDLAPPNIVSDEPGVGFNGVRKGDCFCGEARAETSAPQRFL